MMGFRRARSLLFVLLGAGPAFASSAFPEELKGQLNLSKLPQCTLCHSDIRGGADSLTQPFGLALKEQGAAATDIDKLRTAVNALKAAGTDSDADGTSDIDELLAGDNPNRAGNDGAPSYGCSSVPAGGLAALALLMWAARRQRV